MRAQLTSLAVLCLLLPTAVAECATTGDQESTADPYPVAKSPDLLISNFERAYNERDLEQYARTLHESFVYHFPPEHAHMGSDPGIWDRARELESADRIFHGKSGWNWAGEPHRIVTHVQLQLTPLDDWKRTAPDEYSRVYRLRLTVDYAGGETVFVNRRQEFTVMARRFEHDVELATYTMTRWREFGHDSCVHLTAKISPSRF